MNPNRKGHILNSSIYEISRIGKSTETERLVVARFWEVGGREQTA